MPNLSKNLKKDLKKVESLMRKNLSKEPLVKDLYDYIFDKSGKNVRASISLISSYGMNKNQQNRVKLAAIIELLHTATLVHDDIIDNSDLRRGKTTVNVAWSNSHGVLIGDFIYSKAFMLMNEIGNFKVIDELSSATNKIAEGELMQLANKNNLDTSLQQLKKISYYKTGRLFEASAKSAAMLSGKSTSFIKNISNYNRKYILLRRTNYIKINNNIIELEKSGFLKIYYQKIINSCFDYDLTTTKHNWNELFNFIKESKSSSKIYVKKFAIIKNRDTHFIVVKDFIKPQQIKLNKTKSLWYDTAFLNRNNLKNTKNLLDIINIPKEVFENGLYVRNWKKGDRCYKNNSNQSIKIKKLFENIKISKFEKLIYPILVDSNDTIIYIPNVYNSFDNKVSNKKIYWVN